MLNQIIHGDCFEVLKDIPDNSIDSLITDPPAGIHFMNKDFDHNKGGMLNWVNWLSEIIAHWQLIQIKYRSELEQIQKELESCFQYSKDSDCKELIYNALDALHTDLFN